MTSNGEPIATGLEKTDTRPTAPAHALDRVVAAHETLAAVDPFALEHLTPGFKSRLVAGLDALVAQAQQLRAAAERR